MGVDEQHFDRLAQTVAGQRTRREAMIWLGGSIAALVAFVRGERAAAQATIQLGGACYDSSLCRSDGSGPVFCADNGYDYDGPLNCCRYEGGFCGENHENCCGQLECWNGGYCTNVSVSPRPDPGPGPRYGLPLGASCSDTSECNGGGYGVLC